MSDDIDKLPLRASDGAQALIDQIHMLIEGCEGADALCAMVNVMAELLANFANSAEHALDGAAAYGRDLQTTVKIFYPILVRMREQKALANVEAQGNA